MTSNLGAETLINGLNAKTGELSEESKKAVSMELRSRFKPEFLNRIDEIIFFKPLRMEELAQIIRLMLKTVEARLKERGIKFEITDEAVAVAAKNGYDPIYGARPLKRYLQKTLETPIARLIISGKAAEGSVIRVENQGSDIILHAE